MTYFTSEQVDLLLKPIHPRRVNVRDGMSYVEGYDIKAELNRVFGFGRWDTEILSQAVVCEVAKKMGNGRDGWYVVYRTSLRLIIKSPDGSEVCHYDESHVGESTHPIQGEAHGNALTNSWTYALKRCATNLGDQFGLSLYNKGQRGALVRWTLVRPEAAESERAVDENDVPEIAPEVQPEEPAAQREHPEPQARTQAGDDEVIVTWAAKLDEITTVEDAVPISSELERQHKGGVIDSSRYKVISNALKAKVNSLGASNGHQEQPARPARARGPSAEERGAVAVPTGNGDDGPWVKHFEERLGAARRPDDLDGLQAEIGNAVRARKITPAKSADLSKALRDRRNELEGVAA